jgi:DNA-directed RNA polymerase specialized sigma24 family protein
MQEATLTGIPAQTADMGAERAKKLFFEHWQYLEALARRRFPYNDNLSHEALHYILDCMEADEWRRIRSWQQQGRFLTYLTTMTTRLLTDFSRKQFGHIRKPKWLAAKQDETWDMAYRLLITEKFTQHEVVEILTLRQPYRDKRTLSQIVRTIQCRCNATTGPNTEHYEPVDNHVLPSPANCEPEQQLMIDNYELAEALRCCLINADETQTLNSDRTTKLLHQLQPQLQLSDEDRLILQLRYSDGLSVRDIVKLLHLPGDGYKRIRKIIREIKAVLQTTGLMEA